MEGVVRVLFFQKGEEVVDVRVVAGDCAEALAVFFVAGEAAWEVVAEIDAGRTFNGADVYFANKKCRGKFIHCLYPFRP